MTSEHKSRANRENARASTGPRTKTGKSRSARNAHRHGLSLSALGDPTLVTTLRPLACKIAGADASNELLELALHIAEAHIDIVRIQNARHQLLSRVLIGPGIDFGCDIASREETEQARLAEALADLAPRLIALDRYERRAMSRRKFAIREYDAMLSAL